MTLQYRTQDEESEEEKKENIWYYQDKEIETDDFQSVINSLSASEFTEEEPEDKEEI